MIREINKDTTSARPAVSVSVLAYQHGKYIAQCLDSIVEQKTDFEFEIVVGEDESTDGTREICEEYARKYPNLIRLFLHDRKNVIFINGRPSGRFNFLNNLETTRGKYIAWCDGDDFWCDPLKLQKQFDFLEANPDYVLSYHQARIIDESGSSSEPGEYVPNQPRDLEPVEIVKGMFIPTMTVMFRREHLAIVDDMKSVVNVDSFLFSVIGQFGKGKYQSEIVDSAYRKHSGGIWSKRDSSTKLANRLHTYIHLLENLSPEFREPCARRIVSMYNALLAALADERKVKQYFSTIRDQFAFQRKNKILNLTDFPKQIWKSSSQWFKRSDSDGEFQEPK